MAYICLWCRSRLHNATFTLQTAPSSVPKLHKIHATFTLQVPPPLPLILDALGQLRFAFDELDTLLATLVQIDLTVLCEQEHQLVDRLHLGPTTHALQILCKLFTFLHLAQLLDRI